MLIISWLSSTNFGDTLWLGCPPEYISTVKFTKKLTRPFWVKCWYEWNLQLTSLQKRYYTAWINKVVLFIAKWVSYCYFLTTFFCLIIIYLYMTNNILRKLQHLYVIIYLISLLIIGEILLKWINEWMTHVAIHLAKLWSVWKIKSSSFRCTAIILDQKGFASRRYTFLSQTILK